MNFSCFKHLWTAKVCLQHLCVHLSKHSIFGVFPFMSSMLKSMFFLIFLFEFFSYKFNDMTLPDEDTYKVTIRMFLEFGLVQQYNIPYKVLCRWVLSVKKNYRPVSYHNWRHALNVCQTMFTVLRTGKMDRFMDDLEVSINPKCKQNKI